jgi:hypothetical protein
MAPFVLSQCQPRATRQTTSSCYRFLYLIELLQVPLPHQAGCAPLRRARSRLRAGRRSCLRSAPPTLRRRAPTRGRAPTIRVGHRGARPPVKDMPPAGALRLRDGGGAAGECRPSVAGAGGSHPVCHRPRQSRADAAQGRQGRSYSGALHLDAPEPRPLHGVWADGRRDGSWGSGELRSYIRSQRRTRDLVPANLSEHR